MDLRETFEIQETNIWKTEETSYGLYTMRLSGGVERSRGIALFHCSAK